MPPTLENSSCLGRRGVQRQRGEEFDLNPTRHRSVTPGPSILSRDFSSLPEPLQSSGPSESVFKGLAS